jgi:hypothetical protein
MSVFIYLITAKLPKRAVMMLGMFLMSLGMYLVGVTKFLGFEDGIFFFFCWYVHGGLGGRLDRDSCGARDALID